MELSKEEKEAIEYYAQIVLNLIQKQEKVIDEMAKEIADVTGSCPLDIMDWESKKCKECENTYAECFKQYFYRRVENE